MTKDDITDLMKAIKKLERTFEGDSNDAEHMATWRLVECLKEILHRNYGTLTNEQHAGKECLFCHESMATGPRCSHCGAL